MADPTISARPALEATVRLLQAAALPTEDLTAAHLEHFFHAGSADSPHAVVGVELFGSYALLRSLVVAEEHRGEGLATALVSKAEEYARANGAELIFLLTTTAADFFERRGYVTVDRLTAPAVIRATREFSEICPASSIFMLRKL